MKKSPLLEAILAKEESHAKYILLMNKSIVDSDITSRKSKMEAILDLLPSTEQNRLLRCHPDVFNQTIEKYLAEYKQDPDGFIIGWRVNKKVGCVSPEQISNAQIMTTEERQYFFDRLSRDLNTEAYGADKKEVK